MFRVEDVPVDQGHGQLLLLLASDRLAGGRPGDALVTDPNQDRIDRLRAASGLRDPAQVT